MSPFIITAPEKCSFRWGSVSRSIVSSWTEVAPFFFSFMTGHYWSSVYSAPLYRLRDAETISSHKFIYHSQTMMELVSFGFHQFISCLLLLSRNGCKHRKLHLSHCVSLSRKHRSFPERSSPDHVTSVRSGITHPALYQSSAKNEEAKMDLDRSPHRCCLFNSF